jgi:DNA-binding IclR family transcriptional regulator
MVKQKTTEPKRIQSLQHAMTVVEAIAASEDGLRLLDLAQQAGLSSSAVHHIVDTLCAQGWLVREAQPIRYRLGPVLLGLSGHQRQRQRTAIIDAAMIELLQRSGADSVNLCEAAGLEMLLTRCVRADRPDEVTPVSGSVLQPYTSAASLVHLAYWPAERSQTFCELRPFEVHAGTMWPSRAGFDAALAQTRSENCADLPLNDPHALRLGVPVFDADGALIASLTITVHKALDPTAMRARCIAEGRRITAAIRTQLQGANHG